MEVGRGELDVAQRCGAERPTLLRHVRHASTPEIVTRGFVMPEDEDELLDGARAVATEMSKKAPVYLYQFAYVPEWRKQEQPKGAPHSAEIVYVFDSWKTTSLRVEGTVQPVDYQMAKLVNSCWVAFAKAPLNAKSLSCGDGFTWPAFNEASDDAARFGGVKFDVVKSKSIPNGPPPGAPRGSMAPN